jgi:hypothetical protein
MVPAFLKEEVGWPNIYRETVPFCLNAPAGPKWAPLKLIAIVSLLLCSMG